MGNEAAFVMLEPWFYQSPELHRARRKIDIGLVAEALVFYEQVYLGFQNAEQLVRVISWFQAQGRIADAITLLSEGSLRPYYYAFYTAPAEKNGIWHLMNVQDEEAAARPVFDPCVVESEHLVSLVRKNSLRQELQRAVTAHHVEVKAEDFAPAIENARADYAEAQRAAFLVQIVYDELYKELGYIKPPEVKATIDTTKPGLQLITWNVDFKEFARKLGPYQEFHPGSPLAGAGFGAKTLWSAAILGADLYLGSPLTAYASYKLEEGSKRAKARAIISELITRVEFPDVRNLVNHGKIGVGETLALRECATKFRSWLRSETSFDRDAVLAYLGELSAGSGWTKDLGKFVRLIGLVGGTAAGAALAGPLGAVGGALTGEALKYLTDLATKVDGGWSPKVFGQVARNEIERAVREPKA
jgi:hypothetical protein